MTIIFIILIVLASVILGLIVLVQNPKGGGLAGNIAGFSNQFMGVKQTTDVLEKGTWIFGAVVGALCLISVLFISGSSSNSGEISDPKKAAAPTSTTPPPNPLQPKNVNPNQPVTPNK